MEQFREEIEKILVENDNERTLLLKFFDGYVERNKIKKCDSKVKYILIGIVCGGAVIGLDMETINQIVEMIKAI